MRTLPNARRSNLLCHSSNRTGSVSFSWQVCTCAILRTRNVRRPGLVGKWAGQVRGHSDEVQEGGVRDST